MVDTINKNINVFLKPPPTGLEDEFNTLLTPGAIQFLVDLNLNFQTKIDELYAARLERKYLQKKAAYIPKIRRVECEDENWEIAPVSYRLQNRHVDLGDVSPSNYEHFTSALKAKVQGIQVDFDDGHCPTWKNQILGLSNIYKFVRNEISGVPKLSDAPILMLRPRAWNMMEHNMSINGREVSGPLFDFALLMYHNGHILFKNNCGPCFYLSKLEAASESKLWNNIFAWTQLRLRIPYGTIKACVLIENILAAFEMDQILYELKDHSLGLNCGIWDYAASIIAKYSDCESFFLPDRKVYVNFNQPFLKSYMDLLVETCHKRNAHATGGMAAQVLPLDASDRERNGILELVSKSKLIEIEAGVDGFIIFDLRLVDCANELWKRHGGNLPNQIQYRGMHHFITERDLLTFPIEQVTENGLNHNIAVAILFVYHWLIGEGVFIYKGAVEDSATAEISKAQIWQFIRHSATIKDTGEIITRELIENRASRVFSDLIKVIADHDDSNNKLITAVDLFLEMVNCREFPDFITSYLNDAHVFRKIQSNL